MRDLGLFVCSALQGRMHHATGVCDVVKAACDVVKAASGAFQARRNRRLLATTLRLLRAMAAPAHMGFS